MRWLNLKYLSALILNIIVYIISYKIGTLDSLSHTNPYVYWCLCFTILTFTCSFLLDQNKQKESDIDSLNNKISTLLITKDAIPNAFTIAILPEIFQDTLEINKLCRIKLISNTLINQADEPTIMIKSNKQLFFNMPFCTIKEVVHGKSYIYYFTGLNTIEDFNSQKFFEYSLAFTPKSKGLYEIIITLETEELITVKKYDFSCK